MAGINQSIDQTRIVQFTNNVLHLSQQRMSRLWQFLKHENVKGKASYSQRMGLTEMVEKTGRHQIVTEEKAEWSRRRLTTRPYTWHKWIDPFDQTMNIQDPQGEYSKAAEFAVARRLDRTAIIGCLGTSYSGEEGATAVPLPSDQKLAAVDKAGTGAVHSLLSVETLIQVKNKMWRDEVLMDDGQMIPFVTTADNPANLLRTTEVQSADYNTVKALVNGEVNTFMGFKFIRIEFLPRSVQALAAADSANTGGVDAPLGSIRNFAFVPKAVSGGISQNKYVTADRVPLYNNETLLQMHLAIGATRLEEKCVIEVLTKA